MPAKEDTLRVSPSFGAMLMPQNDMNIELRKMKYVEKYTEDIEGEVVAGLSLEVVGKVGEVGEEDTSDSSSSFSNISSTQTTAHRRHSTYQVSVV